MISRNIVERRRHKYIKDLTDGKKSGDYWKKNISYDRHIGKNK